MKHAQYMANKSGQTRLLVPNFLGGVDIVRAETGVGIERQPVGKAEPEKAKIPFHFSNN